MNIPAYIPTSTLFNTEKPPINVEKVIKIYTAENSSLETNKVLNEIYEVFYKVLNNTDMNIAEIFNIVNTSIQSTSRDPHFIENEELLESFKNSFKDILV